MSIFTLKLFSNNKVTGDQLDAMGIRSRKKHVAAPSCFNLTSFTPYFL
jgi:hypothetical protein